jgi:hypothetical protein
LASKKVPAINQTVILNLCSYYNPLPFLKYTPALSPGTVKKLVPLRQYYIVQTTIYKSVPITTDVVSLNLDQGVVYNIM